MPKLHLYIDVPVPLFKARVNMASVSYPVSQIIFDGVTLGSYTDIQFDATLTLGTSEGGDDLGRVRVQKPASSTIIHVARSPRGLEDGTVTVQDNAYITVWDDYRVWARIPYFDLDNGIDFKDGDVPVGDYMTDLLPVCNVGSWVADYVDADTGVMTVQFPNNGVNLSYPMADGATIDSYNWDVQDGTITVGTSADDVITATFPPGRRWVACSIVDSNGVGHTARCLVVSLDPDDDVSYKEFNVTQRLERSGQTLDIEIFKDLPRGTYPDGTAVLFWWDGMESPGDRSHMKFVGWLSTENVGMERKREGYVRSTRLRAIDVNGRLDSLPGFPQALSRVETESPWSYMPDLDMAKSLHYLLYWHSTAINVADFILPAGLDDYDAMRLDAGGASLFSQVDGQAQKVVPDHYLTCNTMGQMEVVRDWRLDDVGDRPAASPIITESLWNRMSFDYDRHPKVHVLRSGSILSSTEFDEDGEIPVVFSIAPSDASAFSQGTREHQENEGLTLSQEELNACEGHRYAMLNSRYGLFRFDDPTGTNFLNYEPALMKRVQVNIGAAYAAQRGLDFTQMNVMIESINVQYNTDRRGTFQKVTVNCSKEEEGIPAITFIPEEAEDSEYIPPEITIPDFDDDVVFGGDMTGYLAWNLDKVFRTWDLQDSSPVWEDVTQELLGNTILDIQYFMPQADEVGAWVLTEEGIWLCMDILASPPTWVEVLTLATVQAGDAEPTDCEVGFGSMTHFWAGPGHLCVATEPKDPPANPDSYNHAYFWVTFDYGNNWTHVDMNSFLFESSGVSRGFSYINVHGLAAFRSESRIYAVRNTSRTGTSTGRTGVFFSEDGGLTWVENTRWLSWSADHMNGSILHPYPSVSDYCYISRGTTSIANFINLYSSIVEFDEVDDLVAITPPTSHNGGFSLNTIVCRPNKRTFDPNHVILMCKIDASSNADLYESYDAGDTWELLGNFNNSTNTPNGWPPDEEQWVVCDQDNGASNIVQLTLDNFVNLLDRTGNLSIANGGDGTVAPGIVDGFALPKVGVNAD